MIHHMIHADEEFEVTECQMPLMNYIYRLISTNQVNAFEKIQAFVLVATLILVVQLGFLVRPFAYNFFKYLSWGTYLLVPILISYTLGLMGQSVPGFGLIADEVLILFYIAHIWAILLLFSYAGFDNLNAFSVNERKGRLKLVMEFLIQLVLLFLLFHNVDLPTKPGMLPGVLCIFLLVCFKFVEKLVALAHAAGATPRIKREVRRVINYMNQQHVDDMDDPVSMAGFKYLAGPRYEEGVTLEKIWACQEGRLLGRGDPSGQLKDTCLSFSLFWLLLGKFSGFPLYEQGLGSRAKAWRLVRYGLLAGKGEHERVFRVIEVELAFLRDYFHSKYIFFYLNGFYWKLNVLAFPLMFWWVTQKAISQNDLGVIDKLGYGDTKFTAKANTFIISVILALEAMQLVIFVGSRWLKVTFLCYYVKRKTSANNFFFNNLCCWFLEKIGAVYLGPSCSSTNTLWKKPWKRELGQYSLLVQSCTFFPKASEFLQPVFAVVGIPLPKPGRKQDDDIVLPEQVKEAVVLSLQRKVPKLSNGAASLRRNKVTKDFSWACKLGKETDVILVWHIATTVCELHPSSQEHSPQSTKDMKVATSLSKYCAYLLFFASSLLPVPALEAESICDDVIEEARKTFNKSIFACGKTSETVIYKKMSELISDNEMGDQRSSVLRSGAKLGNDLVSLVGDQEKRWKILADLWAEMILYLAPSNSNEMAHAEKLADGGEFITHLWALLIHAGGTKWLPSNKMMMMMSCNNQMGIVHKNQHEQCFYPDLFYIESCCKH